jgi:tRNA (adenine22-N1)-methyltransferase
MISKRLERIASLIPNNSHVIDVGCDHALLDIYLAADKNCTCEALDISASALKGAKNNIHKYKQEKKIKLTKTDGLTGIDIHKDDYIVISGMGTSTIKHILETNKLSNNLIISTHNEYDVMRAYVVKLGYKIIDEIFIIDKDKPYIIIKFEKGNTDYSLDDIMYGPILRYNKEYIKYLQNNLKKIKRKIPFYKFRVRLEINKKIKKLSKISS